MRKVAYIIPGHSERASAGRYRVVFDAFRRKGILPMPVKIDWKGNKRTATDYLNDFLDQYGRSKRKGDLTYLFGYSAGAHVALVATTMIRARLTILCSLPPQFRENLPDYPKKWVKWNGRRRMDEFAKYSFRRLARQIGSPVWLFVGSREHRLYPRLARLANRLIDDSRVMVVPGGRHEIAGRAYQLALREELKRIK